jgi:glycosyltransferase involved in cell wall biosynthesis
MNSTQTVSIVTVTQLSRHKCLLNLVDMVLSQDYINIIEWVIVEGSPDETSGVLNSLHIQKIIEINKKLRIKYIEWSGQSLDELMNLGNINSSGDIIVVMDDDDYYFPTRVSHAVNMLFKSDKLIAGCSNVYMYFFQEDKLYKFNKFGDNHSGAHALAYKKEYLINHKFNSDKLNPYAIESSFTNNFTEPMIQLNPKNTIVVSSHNTNSVSRNDKINNWILYNIVKNKDSEKIHKLIPDELYYNMKNSLIS